MQPNQNIKPEVAGANYFTPVAFDGKDKFVPVRLEVVNFSILMEQVLQDNDGKGGWKGLDRKWLVTKLEEEFNELKFAILLDKSWAEIQREAADLANISLFIVDNLAGGLRG